MKTKEELKALKNEIETLNERLAELSEDELREVVGGVFPMAPQKRLDPDIGYKDVAGGMIGGMQMSSESKPVEPSGDHRDD